MHDGQADSGVPPLASQKLSSESHSVESANGEAASAESTQTLPVPSNGSSERKIEANRRNAKKLTGPKTDRGKTTSSWNSTRHGLLSKRLPFLVDGSKKQFKRLLRSLQQDLEPVGTLEHVLVEKIAQEYWRLGVAGWHEAEEFSRDKPFVRESITRILRYQTAINRQLFQAMN